ncbi:hypothetical protein CASFOL_043182 [Castilleja foliolosa]|uniref:Uncharacterized protein n=1 Tax=Castilleja foliolosa TaxID=1961234 RepID=A0ABD3B6G3_9LAMI
MAPGRGKRKGRREEPKDPQDLKEEHHFNQVKKGWGRGIPYYYEILAIQISDT